MALFGQTFMHSPQRMHFERKSLSASAPGGRIRAGLNVRFEASGWMRNSRPPPKPAIPAARTVRRSMPSRASFGGRAKPAIHSDSGFHMGLLLDGLFPGAFLA